MTELCECKLFVKNENKNENKKNYSRFCHFLVWHIADVSELPSDGSASFAIAIVDHREALISAKVYVLAEI